MPLPDGPTMPRKPPPTSLATSSATSRSRPKKYSASTGSKLASPLNGQTPVGSDARGGRRAGEGLRLLACELQVDDAAGELGLDLAEPASAGGGTRGGVDEPAGRLVDRDGQR